MTQKYAVSDKEASEIFRKSLQSCGSYEIHCNCGREHVCPDSSSLIDYDGHHRDQYLQYVTGNKEKDPHGIIIHYNKDYVRGYDIDGKAFVEDCPCNGLRRYEDWIWKNRDSIRSYLKDRIKQEYDWAEQELTKNKLAGF